MTAYQPTAQSNIVKVIEDPIKGRIIREEK